MIRAEVTDGLGRRQRSQALARWLEAHGHLYQADRYHV